MTRPRAPSVEPRRRKVVIVRVIGRFSLIRLGNAFVSNLSVFHCFKNGPADGESGARFRRFGARLSGATRYLPPDGAVYSSGGAQKQTGLLSSGLWRVGEPGGLAPAAIRLSASRWAFSGRESILSLFVWRLSEGLRISRCPRVSLGPG